MAWHVTKVSPSVSTGRALTLRKQLVGWETSARLLMVAPAQAAQAVRPWPWKAVKRWATQFPHHQLSLQSTEEIRSEYWIIGGESLTNNDPMGEICSTLAVSGLSPLSALRSYLDCLYRGDLPQHSVPKSWSHVLLQSDHWKLTQTAAKTFSTAIFWGNKKYCGKSLRNCQLGPGVLKTSHWLQMSILSSHWLLVNKRRVFSKCSESLARQMLYNTVLQSNGFRNSHKYQFLLATGSGPGTLSAHQSHAI